jgi:hypothetical protein
MQQICDIQKALHHRPFNPNSESHQKFLRNLQRKIDILAEQLPYISF